MGEGAQRCQRPVLTQEAVDCREDHIARRGMVGDVVFGVLSAADDQDVWCHAIVLLTRGPMPVTMVWGMVPAQRAQSRMVGVRPPCGPNTVAVVPCGKDSAPVSMTIWSIETRPTTGWRRPWISTEASGEISRGFHRRTRGARC